MPAVQRGARHAQVLGNVRQPPARPKTAPAPQDAGPRTCPELAPAGGCALGSISEREWDTAAYRAEVAGNDELSQRIRAMHLRAMHNFAANLAEDIDESSNLLDHSNMRDAQAIPGADYRHKLRG